MEDTTDISAGVVPSLINDCGSAGAVSAGDEGRTLPLSLPACSDDGSSAALGVLSSVDPEEVTPAAFFVGDERFLLFSGVICMLAGPMIDLGLAVAGGLAQALLDLTMIAEGIAGATVFSVTLARSVLIADTLPEMTAPAVVTASDKLALAAWLACDAIRAGADIF